MGIILILSTAKKAKELSFCSTFEIYVLMVERLAFALQIIFSAVKKVSFIQSNNFFAAKDLEGTLIKGPKDSLIKYPKRSLSKGPKGLLIKGLKDSLIKSPKHAQSC